jgi:hypothetical protein
MAKIIGISADGGWCMKVEFNLEKDSLAANST